MDEKAPSDQAPADRFMSEMLDWCAGLPEVPLYRRRDDPARAAAAAHIERGLALLRSDVNWNGPLAEWKLALERHLLWLNSLADGQVEAAQAQQEIAQLAERAAVARLRLWSTSTARDQPVFDPSSRTSRFDPRPSSSIAVKLPCPHCRTVADFQASALMAHHRFRCLQCAQPFSAYLAHMRHLQVTPLARGRRYFFQLEGLGHAVSRLSLDDLGAEQLVVARRDLLAFLYAPEISLKAVANLNSGRVLWVTHPGACFVVTVAFGPDAEELIAFRRFRDEVLLKWGVGRWAVARYYEYGPGLAARVQRSARLKASTRRALSAIHRALKWSQT